MINSIELQGVRTFEKAKFEFKEGINLIVGDNGSGKTTLLESIGLFAFGKYLSVDHDSSVISSAGEVGRITASFDLEDARNAEIGLSKKEKIIKVNDRKVPASTLVGLMGQIFFNPETVDVVCGSPHLRRRELDIMISEIDHEYVLDVLNYRMILKERNMLLRQILSGKSKSGELDFWNQKLEHYAMKIFSKREQVIKFYNRNIADVFMALSLKDKPLALKYLPSCDYSRFAEVVIAKTDSDILNGATTVGPHRDDFTFLFNDFPMKEGASRGEQRLAAVAFKALSREYLLQAGIDPIMVLDDVFSELDETRRESVAKVLGLSSAKQVFISATDKKVIPAFLIEKANIIKIS